MVARDLLLFIIGVTGSNKSQEYSVLQLMEETPPVDRVDETLACVCLRRRTDDEVEHSLGQVPGSLQQPGPRFGVYLGWGVCRL